MFSFIVSSDKLFNITCRDEADVMSVSDGEVSEESEEDDMVIVPSDAVTDSDSSVESYPESPTLSVLLFLNHVHC